MLSISKLVDEKYEEIEDSLWKKRLHDSAISNWVFRKFFLNRLHGTLRYINKNGKEVSFFLSSDCIVQELAGKYCGRNYCLRLLWKSNHDLIISTNNSESLISWKHFLTETIFPDDLLYHERSLLFCQPGFLYPSNNFKKKRVVKRNSLNIKSSSVFMNHQDTLFELFYSHEGGHISNNSLKKNIYHNIYQNKNLTLASPKHGNKKMKSNSAVKLMKQEEYNISIGYIISLDPKVAKLNQQYIPQEHTTTWKEFRRLHPSRHQEELKRFLLANVIINYYYFI